MDVRTRNRNLYLYLYNNSIFLPSSLSPPPPLSPSPMILKHLEAVLMCCNSIIHQGLLLLDAVAWLCVIAAIT